MTDRIRAAHCVPGILSGRSFSRKEIAAARRMKLVHGSTKKGTLGGTLFWASSPMYLQELRQQIADSTLVLAALEREWDAIYNEVKEDSNE